MPLPPRRDTSSAMVLILRIRLGVSGTPYHSMFLPATMQDLSKDGVTAHAYSCVRVAPCAAAERSSLCKSTSVARVALVTASIKLALHDSRRYENLVQVRLLLERLATPEDILDRWHELLPQYMAEWQLDRADVRRSRAPDAHP